MQVTCFGFDWEEVRKRPDAEAVVAEMILTDDIDRYATDLPEELWPSDRATVHFALATALAELVESGDADDYPGAAEVSRLIADGESIDELGLGPRTEHTYFVSLSPERVAELAGVFARLDVAALGEACAEEADEPAEELAAWLGQWRDALAFARDRGLGLVGHCG
jgi:hypothetical protein